MRSEHESFRDNFRALTERIDKLEKEAHMYSDKLEDYLKHFDDQKQLYEDGLQRMMNQFVEVQRDITSKFDDLHAWVNSDMY